MCQGNKKKDLYNEHLLWSHAGASAHLVSHDEMPVGHGGSEMEPEQARDMSRSEFLSRAFGRRGWVSRRKRS